MFLVYTSIMGPNSGDVLTPVPDFLQQDKGVEFRCYTDQDLPTSLGWKIIKQPAATNPRRASRMIKSDTPDFERFTGSLWIDGSYDIIGDVRLYRDLLWNGPLYAYRHEERVCLYDEAAVCSSRGLDDINTIAAHMDRYHSKMYPRKNGLAELGNVLRQHCPAIREFNSCWRSEIRNGSVRDQLSFNYVAWVQELEYKYLPGTAHSPGDINGKKVLTWKPHRRNKRRHTGRH